MPDELTPEQLPRVHEEIFAGRKIGAIKLYREFTHLGLKEAKDAVEAITRDLLVRSPERFTRLPKAGGCGTAVLAMVVLVLMTAAAVLAQRAPRGDVQAQLARIADTYGIGLVGETAAFPVKTHHGLIEGTPARRATVQSYATLFIPEFTLYPPSFVKNARLKRIVFCEDLKFAGQRRNAIPDYEHDTLYLDVSRGNYSPSYMRDVIHHEFFHIVDYQDDGSVYADDEWAKLNPPGFKYGTGGSAAQGQANASILTEKYPGFLNYYSTTGVEEDKAEIFAHLLVDFGYLEKRAGTDDVIRAKAQRMHELLAKFCPDMNDEFWENVRKVKRNNDRPEERDG